MLVAFNLILVALVMLIAYWWANQGVFSGLLHLLCVIVSGAIAFAFWEPLTLVLLKGSQFDNFAWAVTLIGLFVIPLAILRLATNKLVPANIDLPHWANLVFGLPIGLCSGILSIGILLIGIGFVQGHLDIMGYSGYTRDRNNAQNITHVGSKLWIPAHELTYEFYSWLSVTSLSTNQPLRQNYPDVHKVAWSQFRDSYRSGRGQVSLTPKAATIEAVKLARDSLNRCMVVVNFNSRAMDFGEQLTLSSSQVRLVSKAEKTAKPHVAHPARWNQAIRGGRRSTFLFDDITYYATSIEGQESTTITFDFVWPVAAGDPKFIQIKGTRFRLPTTQLVSEQTYEPLLGSPARGGNTATTAETSNSGTGRLVSGTDIIVTVSIRPLMISKNMLPGGIKATVINKENFLTEGYAEFPRKGTLPARPLRIKGVFEPDHTKIIQVHVKRGGQADIFGPVRQQAGNNATPVLVDSSQITYTPIGYIYDRGEKVDVKLFPTNRELGSINELPQLSVAGGRTLRLIYRVSEGVQIVSFRLGNVTVATCNVEAVERN